MSIIPGGEPPSKGPQGTIDLREQLFNQREIGPAPDVQVSINRIAILHAILFDLDPHLLREGLLTLGASEGPKSFYDQTVRHWLARDPALARAEVRISGRGLHGIIWLEEPIVFNTEAERDRWTGIVLVVQAVLPIDPDQPGITALTRPVGSTNSKNGQRVEQIKPGDPVPIADVLELFERMRSAPFETVMRILLGNDRVYPCPVCGEEGTSLSAGDYLGFCYGSCGRVKLAQLYDLFLAPRVATSKEAEHGRG